MDMVLRGNYASLRRANVQTCINGEDLALVFVTVWKMPIDLGEDGGGR